MLPPKWKIYRVLNYLMILSVIAIIYIQLDSILNDLNGRRSSITNQVFMVLTLIGFASLIVNSSLNLHFINKYYPNQLPEKWMRNLSIILFIPTLAMVALFIITAAAAFLDEEGYSWSSRPMKQQIAITSVLILICSGIYILWNQLALRKILKRNYKATLENFLEEEKPNIHATT